MREEHDDRELRTAARGVLRRGARRGRPAPAGRRGAAARGRAPCDSRRRPASARTAAPCCWSAAGKAALGDGAGRRRRAADRRRRRRAPRSPPATRPPASVVLHAAHPVPDDAGDARDGAPAGRGRGRADPETLVLTLLSGGASALLVAPAGAVTLADKQAVDRCAARVRRRHRGAQHGPQALLARQGRRPGARRARRGRRVDATALRRRRRRPGDDRVGSRPSPTRPPSPMRAPCVARWLAPDAVPAARRARTSTRGVAGRVAGTVKPGDPVLDHVVTRVLARQSHGRGCGGRRGRARLGFEPHVIREALRGDAEGAARRVVAALDRAPRDRPVAVVAGGETTVRVVRGGRGGRSQHLALAAALALAGGVRGSCSPRAPTGRRTHRRRGGLRRRRHRRPGAGRADSTPSPRSPRPTAIRCSPRPAISCAPGPTGTNVADLVVALRPAC